MSQLSIHACRASKRLLASARANDAAAAKRCLAEGADPNATESGGDSAALLAAAAGADEILQALIEAGADVEKKDGRGLSVALLSALHGQTRCLEVALSAGADLRVQSRWGGWTVALVCVDQGDQASLDVALRFGAQGLDAQTSIGGGLTALMMACEKDQGAMARALIQARAGVDVQNSAGWTAAHWAAWNGSVDCLGALLDAGARADLLTSEGKTALDLALQAEQCDGSIVQVFKRRECRQMLRNWEDSRALDGVAAAGKAAGAMRI
jgi:ankyrin repeat protein